MKLKNLIKRKSRDLRNQLKEMDAHFKFFKSELLTIEKDFFLDDVQITDVYKSFLKELSQEERDTFFLEQLNGIKAETNDFRSRIKESLLRYIKKINQKKGVPDK